MCQAPGPIPETSAEQGGNVEVAEKPQEEAGDGRSSSMFIFQKCGPPDASWQSRRRIRMRQKSAGRTWMLCWKAVRC